MRLTFDTLKAAQDAAKAIHDKMVAGNPAYASSVTKGNTARWAVPYQDKDASDVPIDTKWHVTVKDRCSSFLPAGKTMADATAEKQPAKTT